MKTSALGRDLTVSLHHGLDTVQTEQKLLIGPLDASSIAPTVHARDTPSRLVPATTTSSSYMSVLRSIVLTTVQSTSPN